MADRTDVISNNLHVAGVLSCEEFTSPANSVGDDAVLAGAAIQPGKMKHRHKPTFDQVGTAVAQAARFLWKAQFAGTIEGFFAGVIGACVGDSTITVVLKKNGSSILTGSITINSGHAAYASVAGTLASSSFVANDVFEVAITVSAGTGTLGTGLFGQLNVVENGQ